jgi:hypothetical protein
MGISAFEDKLLQDAVREVLEALYEQNCLDCSHGFRTAGEPETGQDVHRHLVPTPSALVDPGAARRAP